MKLRAIIVDDELTGINSLYLSIIKHCPDVKSVAETKSASAAIDLIENYMPEIVFLDINMPEMNGFELLNKLKWKNFNLIFTTAHQEFALRALKANAIDYLLKPIDPEELKNSIKKVKDVRLKADYSHFEETYEKLLNSLRNRKQNKITIHTKSGAESIEFEDIISLESKSNYTQINMVNSKFILSSKTLKEFDELLCKEESHFMRVHNSFIVNLNKVSKFLKYSESIIMLDAQSVPVSKSRKEPFMKWLKM